MRSRSRGMESSECLLDGTLRRFKWFSLCNWRVDSRSVLKKQGNVVQCLTRLATFQA